jgi:hypothetical protein
MGRVGGGAAVPSHRHGGRKIEVIAIGGDLLDDAAWPGCNQVGAGERRRR